MNYDDFDLPAKRWDELIDQWILNERDRKILKRRIIDGVTFDDLAREFSLSNQRIQSIVYKSNSKLIRHIGEK